MQIHHEIEPIKAYIAESFLYGGDLTKKSQVPITLFSISSYKGDALTFQGLLNDGGVWSYIPLHAVQSHADKLSTAYALDDLVYKNCPGEEIVVHTFHHLNKKVNAYLKGCNSWTEGKYLFTIDWPDNNEQFHLIELNNGQYCALPNHKLLFGDVIRTFKKYKKMRDTWRV